MKTLTSLSPILGALVASVTWMLGVSVAHWVTTGDPDVMGQGLAPVVYALSITTLWFQQIAPWLRR